MKYKFLLALLAATFTSALSAQNFSEASGSDHLIADISECQHLSLEAKSSGYSELKAHIGSTTVQMGYTDEVVPEGIEMPANMRYWLQCVEQAAQDAQCNPDLQLGATSTTESISPLLNKIQWNQSYPFDVYCPSGTPVGCVATATAQVMYYYKYPEHGYGRHTWKYNGITHDVTLDSVYYEWDKMIDKYSYNTTTAQANAVSLLSYHVGVVLNMQYNSGGSGTYSEFIPEALRTHFGYNSHMSSAYRNNYSYEGWNELLQNELRAGRPVVFAANDGQYGHCFVLDGINSKGQYHVNWGWGGYYDGYFDVCILNPEGDGIGGGHSNYGYCYDQTCIINFCPEEGVGEQLAPVFMDSGNFAKSDTQFKREGFYCNCTGDTLKVHPGLIATNIEDQSTYYTFGSQSTLYPYATYGGSKSYAVWSSCKFVPDSMPDGHYLISDCCKLISAQGDTIVSIPTYYYETRPQIAVIDNKFVEEEGRTHGPIITATQFSLQDQELPTGLDTEATIQILNEGDDYFFGEILLMLQGTQQNKKRNIYDDDQNIRIAPGETYEAHFPLCIFEEDDWVGYLRFLDRTMNNDFTAQASDQSVQFSTRFSSDSPARLNLLTAPRSLISRTQQDGESQFRVVLSNAGNTYTGEIGILFFDNKKHTGSPLCIISQEVEIEACCTRDTVIVAGQIHDLLESNTYYAWAYSLNNDGEWEMLLRDGNELAAREIRIFAPAAIEQIHVDELDSTPLYDLMGRPQPADRTRRGLYIRGKQIVSQN